MSYLAITSMCQIINYAIKTLIFLTIAGNNWNYPKTSLKNENSANSYLIFQISQTSGRRLSKKNYNSLIVTKIQNSLWMDEGSARFHILNLLSLPVVIARWFSPSREQFGWNCRAFTPRSCGSSIEVFSVKLSKEQKRLKKYPNEKEKSNLETYFWLRWSNFQNFNRTSMLDTLSSRSSTVAIHDPSWFRAIFVTSVLTIITLRSCVSKFWAVILICWEFFFLILICYLILFYYEIFGV